MTDKWCNLCGYETKQDEDGCVWHQRVKTDADGVQYLKYDEFNPRRRGIINYAKTKMERW